MPSIRHDFSRATGFDSLTAFIFLMTVIFFLLQDDSDRRKRLQAQELLNSQQNAQLRKRKPLSRGWPAVRKARRCASC